MVTLWFSDTRLVSGCVSACRERLAQSAGEVLAGAAGGGKGGVVREALVGAYPRLAHLLEDTLARLLRDTNVPRLGLTLLLFSCAFGVSIPQHHNPCSIHAQTESLYLMIAQKSLWGWLSSSRASDLFKRNGFYIVVVANCFGLISVVEWCR